MSKALGKEFAENGQGFFQLFAQGEGGGRGGGKMRLYELLGGGGHDFGHFIMRNLVKSGTVFAQT